MPFGEIWLNLANVEASHASIGWAGVKRPMEYPVTLVTQKIGKPNINGNTFNAVATEDLGMVVATANGSLLANYPWVLTKLDRPLDHQSLRTSLYDVTEFLFAALTMLQRSGLEERFTT